MSLSNFHTCSTRASRQLLAACGEVLAGGFRVAEDTSRQSDPAASRRSNSGSLRSTWLAGLLGLVFVALFSHAAHATCTINKALTFSPTTFQYSAAGGSSTTVTVTATYNVTVNGGAGADCNTSTNSITISPTATGGTLNGGTCATAQTFSIPANATGTYTVSCTRTWTAPASPLASYTLSASAGAAGSRYDIPTTTGPTYTRIAADMSVSLASLPATATVGVAYTGSAICTNATGATTATNAGCSASGLPAGLSVGACSPPTPASVTGGGSITCPVTGTPTTAGAPTVTGSTGSTNDSNSGNNLTTKTVTVGQGTQTITFAAPANQVFGSGSLVLGATASSGLTVSYAASPAGVCTVAGNNVTLVGVGTCTITASQAGNTNYLAASNVVRTFDITPAAAGLTLAAITNKVFGSGNVTAVATTSSNQTLSYGASPVGVCLAAGATVSLVGVGTCTVTASQPAGGNYQAGNASTTFDITPATPVIAFANPGNKVFGSGTFTVSATSPSAVPVTFTAAPAGVCTISGNTVTLVGVGGCTVTANQAAGGNYQAGNASTTFDITPTVAGLTLAAITNKAFGSGNVTEVATTSSNQTLSYGASPAGVCSAAGATVSLVGVGTCTVTASQPAGGNYQAGNASTTFDITPATPVIAFANPGNKVFGSGTFTVSASSPSAVAVTFAAAPAGVCTISTNTVTLVGVGGCTVTANQAAGGNYTAAAPVAQTFNVTSATNIITFDPLTDRVFGTTPPALAATANSGLTVAFASQTSAVCTVSGTSVTLVAPGACTIRASQPGNANHAAAAPVDRTFQVLPAIITFPQLPNIPGGGTPPTLRATRTLVWSLLMRR